jgi:hypothetical protein
MQGIYTYIPETNHVRKEYNVAAILSLLFILIIIIIIIIIIISGSAVQRGLWSPRSRGFVITHNDAPQSAGFPWTSDQLVAETYAW